MKMGLASIPRAFTPFTVNGLQDEGAGGAREMIYDRREPRA